MLTKNQQQELEKAILGYLVSKKYFQTVSALVQESPTLLSADFLSLRDPPEVPPDPSQLNLVFNISKDDSSFALSKNAALADLSVSLFFSSLNSRLRQMPPKSGSSLGPSEKGYKTFLSSERLS